MVSRIRNPFFILTNLTDPHTFEVELEDYRVKKNWVVFEVDLNNITPMEMVSKAAQKVHHKLPVNMHYRSIFV